MFYRLLYSLSYLLNVWKNTILVNLISDKKSDDQIVRILLNYVIDDLEFWMIAVTMVFQQGYWSSKGCDDYIFDSTFIQVKALPGSDEMLWDVSTGSNHKAYYFNIVDGIFGFVVGNGRWIDVLFFFVHFFWLTFIFFWL